MKQLKFNTTQLQDFLVEKQKEWPELITGTLLENIDFTHNNSHISQYFIKTQNWCTINNCDFNYDREKSEITLFLHPESPTYCLKRIKEFASWVSRSYGNQNYPWENNAIEKGFCDSDEDIVHNSYNLYVIIDAIAFYIRSNS